MMIISPLPRLVPNPKNYTLFLNPVPKRWATFNTFKFGQNEKPRNNFGDRYGAKQGDRYGDRFGGKYGDNFGDKRGDSFGDKRGDRFGDKYGDRFGGKYGDSAPKDVPPVEVLNVYKENEEVAKMDPRDVEEWRENSQVTVSGENCPNPILKFEDAPFLASSISQLSSSFPSPSVIQSQAWPIALSGRDMVGSAATGSGKTLAFLLPAFEQIKAQMEKNPQAFKQINLVHPLVLVLAPTRELAQQIHGECLKYSKPYKIRSACLFGGAGNRSLQISQLSMNPHVIIATPGRLIDFINEGKVDLARICYLVLDEADRMLEMGFEEQIRKIVDYTSNKRQTLMWSATWPKAVESLARDYFRNYVRVNIGSLELQANPNIQQTFIFCEYHDKKSHLLEHIKSLGKTIIFCGTKRTCEELGYELSRFERSIPFAVLHGDKTQMQRNNILSDFRSDTLKLVIATDVAARGLDVSDIETVINYDLPNNIESYIHRVGRTARAGKKGLSLSFFTRDDIAIASDIADILQKSGQTVPAEISKIIQLIQARKQQRQPSTNRQRQPQQRVLNSYQRDFGLPQSSKRGRKSFTDFDDF